MEVNASSLEKKEANEVVLMIPFVECQSRGSLPTPNTEPTGLENPPSSSRISNVTSPSALELTQSIPAPSKLPNIPTGKSISGSSSVPHPSDTSTSASKDAVKRVPSMSPTSSVPSQVAKEEDDDEDVFDTVNHESRALSGKSKVFVAQLVAFVCLTGLLIASLTIHILRDTVLWHVHLWGWCLLMLAIFCGSLVADMLIKFLVFLIEKKFLRKKKVFYFLYGLKDSAEVFAWSCLVLLAWVLLINHGVKRSRHVTKILNWVTRALASCLIGAALWLIKTFLLKLHISSSKGKRYFDRIHDQVFKFHVINKLSSSATAKIDLKVKVDKLLKMKRDKVSAWTTKKLVSVVSSWEPSTLTDSLNEAEQQDEEITDEQKAKRAAKAIFNNVASPGSKFIEESDLLRFMPKEDVERLFSFIPQAKGTRRIRRKFFKVWLGRVFREQKLLTQALNDANTGIEDLNSRASAALLVVVIIPWLLLTGLLTTQVVIFISSQLVLFAFLFGDAAKRSFEGFIFVFVIHPFDVSDRCVVDGVEMVVEETNIMNTVFLKDDREKIYFPNSELASKLISNLSRSPDIIMSTDSVEFTIDFSTSDKRIKALRDSVKTYLENKPEHWRPDHSVEIKEIADADRSKILKMSLHVTHTDTMNFQDSAKRTRRRSDLVQELKKILERLHLNDSMPPQ